MDGGGWYSGGASRCRAAEHHWIFGDSDDNRARAGHGMFCAASSNPRSIPVGYGLTDGCISDGYHSDCSSCKRDLWTLDNRHARVSRPPCDHISWPPSLSFLVNARLSEGGGREGPHRPGHGKKILYGKSMGKWTVGTHGSMLKVKGLSLQRGLPITFLHKFLPVVMAFFQDSTFACLALFPPGQSRPRRMYGNLLSCILVKRHSFSPYV